MKNVQRVRFWIILSTWRHTLTWKFYHMSVFESKFSFLKTSFKIDLGFRKTRFDSLYSPITIVSCICSAFWKARFQSKSFPEKNSKILKKFLQRFRSRFKIFTSCQVLNRSFSVGLKFWINVLQRFSFCIKSFTKFQTLSPLLCQFLRFSLIWWNRNLWESFGIFGIVLRYGECSVGRAKAIWYTSTMATVFSKLGLLRAGITTQVCSIHFDMVWYSTMFY